MNQPVDVIGPKMRPDIPSEVSTPVGALSFEREMSIRREWGFATSPASVAIEGSRAEVSFHLGGSDEDDVPTILRVAFMGGAERWRAPRGEPIEHEGRKIAWSCHGELDLRTGKPGPLSCLLSEYDPPDDRRVAGIMAPTVRDDGLVARLERSVGETLARWAGADRGYAARIYGAMMRVARDDLEDVVDRARLDFLAALARRDRFARLGRRGETAAKVDAGHWPPAKLDEALPEAPHAELRGFGGQEPLDGRNLDEIIVVAPSSLHVETMSDKHTWMGVYLADGRRLAVNFLIEKGKLKVGAEIDDEGF